MELIEAIYRDRTEVPVDVRVGHSDAGTGTGRTTLRIQSVEGAGA
jgi:hypothetical protein